ncbi:tetratricopeptide repeat protein [Neosynechococcus sphagnicola]|uniref:O-linked N-acetylglucosamine transferase, SPINDLY family protein n=1 Tax=Neosynechococcus sphagnicola TaxID=1501145 RepID=UPI00068D6F45|nr:glycosyltransferase family 41 protein [Neosynechococcus sphagnicola]
MRDLHQQATDFFQQGDYAAAIALYQECITIEPEERLLYWDLGLALLLSGQALEAQGTWLAVLTEAPSEAIKAWTEELIERLLTLAETFVHPQDGKAVTRIHQQILDLDPHHPEALKQVGIALGQQGQWNDALAYLQTALAHAPEDADLHRQLGLVLEEMGDLQQAIACYQNALVLQPEFPEAYNNLGIVLHAQGKVPEAIHAYQQALVIEPTFYKAYNNLGQVLRDQGDLLAALNCYQQAQKLQPEVSEIYRNLGLLYLDLGDLAAAIAAFEKAVVLNPNSSKDHATLLLFMLYSPEYSAPEIYTEAIRWGNQHGNPAIASPKLHSPKPNRRLRVGYVSPDLRTHSVAYFLAPILQHHHKAEFEIFAYAQVDQPDATTHRFKGWIDHWYSTVGIKDAQLVDQIRSDRIDILIDLAGHTANNRLQIFSHQPAPVQISYLGYPSTSGLKQIHYRITDPWADPEGTSDAFYTEKLIRLPGCFLCYQPPSLAPPGVPLPAATTGQITFGCFNNLAKVNLAVLRLWSQILGMLPTAQMLLKSKSLQYEAVRNYYWECFAEYGIERDRVQLAGSLPDLAEHLGLYNQVDIALDPFPYNGTTTTCEALWMGVPVLTLAGTSHAGRVGVSLLSTIGLPDWIATTPDDYVIKAVDFARNRAHLADLRLKLRSQMAGSPLCDAPSFTRKLEMTYQQLWQHFCAGHLLEPS